MYNGWRRSFSIKASAGSGSKCCWTTAGFLNELWLGDGIPHESRHLGVVHKVQVISWVQSQIDRFFNRIKVTCSTAAQTDFVG